MASKARDLSNFISVATVDASEIASNAVTADKIADAAVTHAKLHTDMNLSGKTLTFATNQISGNAIDGGVISNFTSTGIDDNSSSTSITLLGSGTVGVGGTSSSYGKLTITQSTDASNGGLGIVDSGNALSARLFSTGTAITLNAGNTGTGKLVLNAGGGNVGIGTTSPSTKLHVDGGGSSPEIRIAQNSTYYTDIGINHIDVAGNDLRFLFDGNEKGRYTNEGVLGLGVIPGAWSANYPALQIGQGATFTGHVGNTQTQLGQNWWIGTANQYVVDGAASRMIMNPDSTIIFSQAPSGTAGATMSTTHNRLVIDASGVVTMPAQPAMFAQPDSSSTVAVGTGATKFGWNTSGGVRFNRGFTISGAVGGSARFNAANTGRITVPSAGIYKLYFTIRCEGAGTSGQAGVFVNGTQYIRRHVEEWATINYNHFEISATLNLSASDYIELGAWWNGTPGGALSGTSDTVNWMSFEKIS